MSGGIPQTPFDVAESIRRHPVGYRAVQVLEFLRLSIGEHGRSPSYTEIMIGVGIGSKGEVSRIIQSLESRGLVRHSLVLTEAP